MARTKGSRLVKNTCEFCGKEFYSAQRAEYCTDKSTCRVKAHQAKAKSTKAAKSLMMNFSAYETYKGFVERFPLLKDRTDKIFFEHGVDAMMMAIDLSWEVALKLRSN